MARSAHERSNVDEHGAGAGQTDFLVSTPSSPAVSPTAVGCVDHINADKNGMSMRRGMNNVDGINNILDHINTPSLAEIECFNREVSLNFRPKLSNRPIPSAIL